VSGPITVGIGIHAGETVTTDEGYVGSVVNIAARVCAQADAGELLVTDAVRSMTRTFLGVTFSPRGRKRLKGISEPIALYRVTPVGDLVSESSRRRVMRHWPVAAMALGILLVVLASALIGGALIRESAADPGASPRGSAVSAVGDASTSPAPSASTDVAFPTADETRLLDLVEEGDRRHCERAAYEERPVIAYDFPQGNRTVTIRAQTRAGITCDLGGFMGPDRLWLWQIVEARDQEGDPAAQAVAALAGRIGATPGSCRERRPSFETWSFGGISGKLVCYETETGDAVLLWVYDDDERRLFARAVRDDRDMAGLLDWWEDVGRFAAP
jgi:hypothetical protein